MTGSQLALLSVLGISCLLGGAACVSADASSEETSAADALRKRHDAGSDASSSDASSSDASDAGTPNTDSGTTDGSTSSLPPPPDGYITELVLPSAPNTPSLPSTSDCAGRVHRSTWEIRPENAVENATIPNYADVQAAFAAARRGGFDPRWNTWLLPRIDGAFTGTTDEIFQWAACKWGLPDNVIRAIAVRESTWFNYLHWADGSPYGDRGSGDLTTDDTWCRYISGYGVPYANPCPQTFGIVGVKSRETGSGYLNNNNGTFPFNKNSTAFSVDDVGAELRACYEGWVTWLKNDFPAYAPGDLWGCVGYWYSGEWHTQAADTYIAGVQSEIANHTWLTSEYGKSTYQYHCDPTKGCPQ